MPLDRPPRLAGVLVESEGNLDWMVEVGDDKYLFF